MEPKMSEKNGTAANLILEGHEDRLQHVEAAVNDTRLGIIRLEGSLAETNMRLETFQERNDSHHSALMEKLRPAVELIETQKKEVECLKQKEEVRVGRAALVKKIGWAFSLAGGAVLAENTARILWIWLTKIPQIP